MSGRPTPMDANRDGAGAAARGNMDHKAARIERCRRRSKASKDRGLVDQASSKGASSKGS
eukprot:CAMPEP_0206838008 /NCGR_PEP_ID=MMETSP0975-20121206/20698_1 /ASSEMBLY_ACC=CAM_ASM_000399 /TAXON_ID=483370 /ORGANISM="non described non described, Strain CCMP2097" /LENGTH=59 /DNA_ID=CAMNT_0054380441 /DNA_START=82 /DNA_END=258 /DNA_ORIENTATION=+